MKKFLSALVLILLCCTTSLTAQNKVTIKGAVVDAQERYPLEYATISFSNPDDNEIVNGGITDLEGHFNIEVVPGTYDVKIEYLSYKSKTYRNKSLTEDMELGTVGLVVDMSALDEVNIVAERTTVEIKLDKKIYNIGSDITTAGGTVSDALNNVPSVAVDIEGGISLRGNENVKILINGKPSAMAGFGDTNVLSQLPAEAIERVEVITSPSARYDAEGTAGILNIILRQKETLGFNGSLTLNLGTPEVAGLAANLNYRTEKFNVFSNVGFRYYDSPRSSLSDTKYFDRLIDGQLKVPQFDRIVENQEVSRLNRYYNANVGMEYFLSDKTSLTGSLFYRYKEDADVSRNNSDRFKNDSKVERTLRQEREKQDGNSYQIALNYVTKFNDEGHQLTADFQYGKDDTNEKNLINEDYILSLETAPDPFQKEQITNKRDQKEYLFQADYVLPIGEDARFEAGYRGNFKNNLTDYQLEQEDIANGNFFINDTITNVFNYKENVNAVYSQYGTKFGQFSFLLGLRLENTQLKGKIDSRLADDELVEAFGFPIDTDFDKNYLGLFPTVNLIYSLGKDDDQEESLTLGYNRRINRPRGWYINPFPTRSSRTRVFQGNPNLDPAFSSAFDLGYLKRWDKFTLTTSVYYQYETDSFERVEENTGQQTTDGIDIIRTIPVNLSNNIRTGAELGILYNPKKWLRLNTSLNFFQFKKEGDFNGIDYGTKNTSWYARFSGKVTLPGKIDWQTNAFYRGASESAQTKTDGLFMMDLAFSKEILKDKATLSLNVRDVFNSGKRNQLTTTEFFERYSESQWRKRSITLSLRYRFNMQKQKDYHGEKVNSEDDEFEFQG